MKPLTLMYMLATFRTMMSMPKMVSGCTLFFTVFIFFKEVFLLLLSHICAEHFNPLLEQISKLEEALYNIQFEQHWLEAQTERQAIGMY